jgi:aspartyl-tRNA(Asn)/glutamyl-tRNA(Gln) amidotransferase subunit B
LRSKEEAHDYRYFPEPDLVPLVPTEEMLRAAREALPELPAARIERYESELGLAHDVALTLATDPGKAEFFEETLASGDAGAVPVANWVTGELAAVLRQLNEGDESELDPGLLAALIEMVQGKKISHQSGKAVLVELVLNGGDPEAIVEREGLAQLSDSGELEAIVEKAMADNPAAVEKIREGNGKAIGAIVGAVMRETQGRADGGEVNRIIRERL